MNRRRSERQPRRVQVQFWQPGEETHGGFTTNLSPTGMHIATPHPLPPQARVRIEVIHGERGFMVEGVVAHRRSVHPELARVAQAGMGVRFLTPQELINELFPPAPGGLRGTGPPGPSAANFNDSDAGPQEDERVFSVRFASAKDFLGTYRRDIINGGLFVATGRPGRLRELVTIDLYPPDLHDGSGPVRTRARVVQRFQPEPGSGAILVGMGVELLDLPLLLARLRPLVERLEA